MPEVSIVIPAYNEQGRLPKTIRRLKGLNLGFSIEVIIVVEKSQDKTLVKARQAVENDHRFLLVDNVVHRGKGYAVRTGILKAKGKYIFFMDADFSTDSSALKQFVKYFRDHTDTDVLIGNREHVSSNIVSAQKMPRRTMGRTFNLLVRAFIFSGFKDTQCGFKAFRREAALNIFRVQTTDGFAFDVEILMLAQKMNYKIVDLPVIWTNSADSRVGMVGGSFKMLKDLLVIKRKIRSYSFNSAPEPVSEAPTKPELLEITDS